METDKLNLENCKEHFWLRNKLIINGKLEI